MASIDWSTVLPQMREFVSKFTLDQIKENPLACECGVIDREREGREGGMDEGEVEGKEEKEGGVDEGEVEGREDMFLL